MNEPLITECPGCHSRFRVTEGQLNLAQGQVRCGACLLVFDARIEARRLERHQREIQVQQKRSIQPKPEPLPDPVRVVQTRSTDSRVAADTDELADRLLAAGKKLKATPATADEPAKPAPPPPVREEPVELIRDEEVADDAAQRTEAPPDNIPHLYAEPILLEISREKNDPFITTGWALASLLALLTLAGQYLWFERATLAHHEELHPIYLLACDSLPCELDNGAYRSIVNQGMVVRPHPAFADALSVDIQLRNDAAFAQPFPALSLSFTDLKGRPVASRVFKPQEYLPVDRRGELMQPMTPVQLQLEITDPGVHAVSYQLELLPAS
ncbi:zinc-ribbon and DUF3426 domain-containing protein [Marinobacterium sp. D7]|uniref:zinc-ribbon and DUF3426 domain-containing protein n=1 Tax=Marinobacterium ramblicola TaxID=2849041 RepID=UPI001C2D98C0|nr:zinc-ribbon and DUF3426 domain-containing protein [Marinobacterium ramblicola]MBV1786930.1 zinc-ribbon and DUF3426 domain-containing protein [Marinobacterium ramblicola]